MPDKMKAELLVSIDADLEARLQVFSNGCGIPLDELIEHAIVYAFSTLYPDNELPEGAFEPGIDNELPEGEIPVDPDYGVEEGEEEKPIAPENLNPDLDPNLNPDLKKPEVDPQA